MNHLLARKKSSLSFRGKLSEAGSAAPSSTTPSDQKPREAKGKPKVLYIKAHNIKSCSRLRVTLCANQS